MKEAEKLTRNKKTRRRKSYHSVLMQELLVNEKEKISQLPTNASEDAEDDDSLYYDLDSLLNETMRAQNDLTEALTRLDEVEKELIKVKAKYVFLCETSWTNRILAEGFMSSSYEKYSRTLSRKKAIEESVNNCQKTFDTLKANFQEAISLYQQSIQEDKDLTETPEHKPICQGDYYDGEILEILSTGYTVKMLN